MADSIQTVPLGALLTVAVAVVVGVGLVARRWRATPSLEAPF